jgi:hypothetical protein
MPAWNCSSVKLAGSAPCHAMMMPMVSRISESTVMRPLSLGSQNWSREVSVSVPRVSCSSALFQPKAPKPENQGNV